MTTVPLSALGPAAQRQVLLVLDAERQRDELRQQEKKPSKYRNCRTVVDGIAFDSTAEAKRWGVLKLLQAGGQISRLQRQVNFPIVIDGALVTTYRADFVYFEDNHRVIEDVKGFRTKEYILKKKLVEACYRGVTIIEVKEHGTEY